jgi:hypothetical protein
MLDDSYSPESIARALGGDISADGQIVAPGPGHSQRDRSLSIKIDPAAPDGFVVESFASDDWKTCRDHVRQKLGLPEWQAKAKGGGGIVATYDYRDESGTLISQAVRLDPKDFRQRRPDGAGDWTWKVRGVRAVPYRLPELLEAVAAGLPVFVVEGEKDADALARLDLAATCNAGGAGKWRAAHSKCLKGADVIILPDNDAPGRDHAEAVAASLAGIAARVRTLTLPDLPDKGDVSDWLAAGGTAEALWQLAEQAPEWRGKTRNSSGNSGSSGNSSGYGHNSGATDPLPDDPIPLFRPLIPGAKFPEDALGNIIGPAVRALHESAVQAPFAMCTASALAAAAISTQTHANITLPHGETVPLSLYLLVIAESGERKSSLHKRVLEGVTQYTKDLEDAYKEKLFKHRVERAAWEAEKRIITNDKKIKHPERIEKLTALGPEPTAPKGPLVMVKEPTMQGLEKVMIAGQHSIGLVTSEAGEFLGGHSMGKERITGTLAKLNSLWDGDGVERIRAGEEPVICRDRRLSLFFQLQPHLSTQTLTNPIVRDIGFLSRLLICRPESAIGTRFGSEVTAEQTQALLEFSTRSFRLMNRPLPLSDEGMLEPPALTFTQEAAQAWTLFNHFVERAMAEGGSFEAIRGFASKLGQHAARIAGVMLRFENHDALEIGTPHLQRGIDIALFYASEALRLQGIAEVNPDLVEAHSLLEWLSSRWESKFISVTEIVQYGPNAIRDADKVRELLGILESNGHVCAVGRAEVNQPNGKSKPRLQAWRIAGKTELQRAS